jgi:basic membrane protein A
VYYTWAAQQMIDGAWSMNQYWGSWQDGVVDLSPISDIVPEDVKAVAEAEIAKFSSGEEGVTSIFTGPLLDQDGNEKVADGVAMSDEEILNMDWFVQGVQGDL